MADVFYGVSVKKAERELVRCICFPHLFIFRGGKKKGKSEKLTTSCITGKLHGEWITRNTVMKAPRDQI